MRIFWRIAALFWKYWPRVLITYLCLLAGAGLSLLIPRLTGDAVDLALGSGQINAIVMVALAIGAAGLGRSLLGYFQSYLAEYLSQKVAYDLRNAMYDHLQRLSYAFHDRSQTGQLMSRATQDVEGVRVFVAFAMLRAVYFLVLALAVALLMLLLDWKLALISLSVLPLISYRTIAINKKLRVLWMKVQQGLGVMGTILQENLTGNRVVRAFAREDYESRKFRRQAEQIYEQEMAANNLLAVNSPVMTTAIFVAMAAILWYGGGQVITGALTQGQFVQFLLYLVMLTLPVRMLGWLTILYSRAMASGKRVYEILDQTSPVVDRPGARDIPQVSGRVTFEEVCFGYNSGETILDRVSFDAQPGQIIALVGASGSGKSTVANLIPRFYDVSSGRVLIDGFDVRDFTLASLRRHIGMVHQDTFLFSASIRENIGYGKPDASLDQIIAAAKLAHLHDFIAALPQGYDSWVGERGFTLSGGQKQRLAIARSLLLDPRILIMDDSTSSVDTETEYLIQKALAEVTVGRTTLIIAHRLRSVQMADLILVMKDGRIVERGKHQALLARHDLYSQLYSLQFAHQETADLLALPEMALPISLASGDGDGRHLDNAVSSTRGLSLKGSDDIVFGKPYDSAVVSRMAKYFAPYKVALTLTILATLLFTATTVASPYLVSLVEDNYIVAKDINGLSQIVLLFLANALLNGLAYYTQIRAEARLGQSILLNLRVQVFDHLQKLSVRFFDHNEVGRIMSRVQNDIGELGEFLDSGAFWVLGEIVSLGAIMVVMLGLDLKLALCTLAVIPLLIVFVLFWQKRARLTFVQVRQAISRVNAALEENISGVRVIQSLSREDLNSRRFAEVNQANLEANLQAARISAAMMPAVELLVSIATAVVILFGGLGVLNGTLLIGLLLAFLLYVQRFFDPIRTLTMEYAQLQRAMASGVRVFELLDVPLEMPDSPVSLKPSALRGEITFKDVSFSYLPELEVLHDINLHIAPGTTTALVGPTGAGKSTIISLIARFYEPDRGRILIDGQDLRSLDKQAYRSRLGLVLQDPFLFSGTLRENIAYGNLQAGLNEIIAAAKTVGAHEFILHLEKGYDTELQERGQNLSMGQRQLISFARALLADPAILLLDEATASIDSYSEEVLRAGLQRLMQGRTTLVIAHRLSTVRHADKIVVLDAGRIVEEGQHAQLVAQGGLYARLYELTSAAAVPLKPQSAP